MKYTPLVSVILPVYNNGEHIAQSLESILNQSYKLFELIIIDDGSTDASVSIINRYKDPRIKLHQIKHQSVAGALNVGLSFTKGKYIARMDADDIASPQRFEKQVQHLENNRPVGVLGTAVELIGKDEKKKKIRRFPLTNVELRHMLIYRNPFIHPTVLFRKSLVEKYGGYDELLDGAEDYDLWLRWSRHTKMENLPDILLQYRLNKDGVSYKHRDRLEKAFLRARWKSIDVYGYPFWQIIFLIKPLLSICIHQLIKRRLTNA